MNKRSKVGASLACYLPWSAYWPNMAARWAQEDGYDFLGILPFRRIKKFESRLPVLCMEEAWNPANLIQVLLRQPQKQGEIPQLWDFVFFPGVEASHLLFTQCLQNFQPTIVVHQLNQITKGKLLEISPKLGMSATEIIEMIKNKNLGQCLVLDLYHLRQQIGNVKDEKARASRLGDWKKSLPALLPYTALIHVQPYRESKELAEIISGANDTELQKMLEIIREQNYIGPYMIESSLGIMGIYITRLRRMMQKMRTLIS